MKFEVMLDTNIVSDFMRAPEGKAAARLDALGPDRACISIIVAAELRYGARKAKSPRIAALVESALAAIPILPLELPVDAAFAEIRNALAVHGRPIGPTDLFIAAHALALDLTLITASVREFSRVPGLRVENWLAD
jgi:tRNA(fMet)-specific endonuclease VapC